MLNMSASKTRPHCFRGAWISNLPGTSTLVGFFFFRSYPPSRQNMRHQRETGECSLRLRMQPSVTNAVFGLEGNPEETQPLERKRAGMKFGYFTYLCTQDRGLSESK